MAQLIFLIAAVTFEFVVGMALNIHVLLVYKENLRNGLPLCPSEKVHVIKALINVSQLLVIIGQTVFYAFWSHLFFINESFRWMMMINMVFSSYSYWLMALLCVYYFINITSTGLHVMVWLKRSLSSYLHPILLALGLGSVAMSFPVFWLSSMIYVRNTTCQSPVTEGISLNENVIYKTISAMLGSFLPLTISLVSTALTSWSLIHHMWTMKQNNRGFACSEVQRKAARTMILFLLIGVMYNVIQMLFFTMTSTSRTTIILMWLVVISYPIAEAVIIIQSSSKLKRTLDLRPKIHG